MSVIEIFVLLVVALIVIPPERLPEVMQAVGKIMRELRLASNAVMRELSGAIEDPPYMQHRAESVNTPTEPPPPADPPAQV